MSFPQTGKVYRFWYAPLMTHLSEKDIEQAITQVAKDLRGRGDCLARISGSAIRRELQRTKGASGSTDRVYTVLNRYLEKVVRAGDEPTRSATATSHQNQQTSKSLAIKLASEKRLSDELRMQVEDLKVRNQKLLDRMTAADQQIGQQAQELANRIIAATLMAAEFARLQKENTRVLEAHLRAERDLHRAKVQIANMEAGSASD
jgi:hypothetical protein